MSMNEEHRQNIIKANKRRSNCPQCNNVVIEVVDGKEIGGQSGINYKRCNSCGWTRAITHRPRKFKF